jgi:DNA replication protein DnaC
MLSSTLIDEVGYLTYGPDAANVLFHVVNDRHLKKRPMIFTTNKSLSEWGKVLHDEDLAAAILDRILERGRLIPSMGPRAAPVT